MGAVPRDIESAPQLSVRDRTEMDADSAQVARWTVEGAASAMSAAAKRQDGPPTGDGCAQAEVLLSPCSTTILVLRESPDLPDAHNAKLQFWMWLPLLNLRLDETRWREMQLALHHAFPSMAGQCPPALDR